MRSLLAVLSVLIFSGCVTHPSRDGWTAAEILAGRKGVPPLPSVPDCPLAFPKITQEHLASRVGVARTKLGFAASLQGPYTAEILDWIEKNGRLVKGSITSFRQDYIDGSRVTFLKDQIAQGKEVYFYEWYIESDGGVIGGGQCGFITFDHDTVVDVMVIEVV